MNRRKICRFLSILAANSMLLLLLAVPSADASTVIQGTNMSTNGDYLLSANDFLWSASNGYVDVYDSNESLVDSIYLDGHGAQSMCATPDGSHVYVTMNDTGLIYEVDPNTLSINNYYQSEYVQRFTGCASDGNTVFFTAYDDSEVRAYTLDLSNYYGGSCSSCWAVTYNSYTDEYAATSDDWGYIYNFDASTVDQYDSDCTDDFCYVDRISTRHSNPTDIIFAGGYLWMADYDGYIEQYSPTGSLVNNFSLPGLTNAGYPWRLTYAMGSVWATLQNHQIVSINASTRGMNFFDLGGSRSYGIATYQGVVYIGDNSQNLVKIVSSNAPPAPSGLSATRSNGSISVSWNAATSATQYRLELRNSGTLLRAVTLNQRTWVFNGVSNAMSYVLRVAGVNSSGTGNYASTTVQPAGPPSAPTITSTQLGASTAQFNYHLGASNGSSIVSSRVIIQPSGKACSSSGTSYAQSCSISGLTPGVNYVAYATSTNAFGTSSNSAAYRFAAIGVPSAPRNFSIRVATKSALLTFNAPSSTGGSAISIYQYSLDGGRTWMNSLYGKSVSFPVTGLRTGSTYSIGVRAKNAAGFGLASNYIRITAK